MTETVAGAGGNAGTVDKSGVRVRRMFSEIAPRYDFLNHLLSLNVDRFWRWRTVRAVAPSGDAPILDLCTGTGDLALAYARAARKGNKNCEVVGADFCPEMLALAEKKRLKAASDGQRVRFVEADATALPFEDNRFQIVSVAFGLRNVSDTDKCLREMVRTLQPGGRLAVLEFSMPSWQPFKAIYSWYFRRVLPKIGRRFSPQGDHAYDYLPASVQEFPHGEALAERLRATGLIDVWHRPMTLGVATLYCGKKA